MSLTVFTAGTSVLYVPRASGDEPNWVVEKLKGKECSPRERG